MNTSLTLKSTMLLLAGCLFLATPVFARQGADDPAGHVPGGNGADDPANHNVADDKGGANGGGNGADDPANHNVADDKGGANGGGNGADDPANHDVGDDNGGSKKSRTSSKVVDDSSDPSDTTVARGKFRQTIKKNRTDLRLDVKLKDPTDLPNADAADAAVVTALFDDGAATVVTCELDFDDFEHGKAEYQLRLRQRGGSVTEKAGDCGGVLPPVVSGQAITIQLALDPTATPKTVGTVAIP